MSLHRGRANSKALEGTGTVVKMERLVVQADARERDTEWKGLKSEGPEGAKSCRALEIKARNPHCLIT